MRAARSRLRPLAIAALALLGGSSSACKDRSETGELASPEDAAPFESQYRNAFDDDYTPQGVNLMGRAPNDVLDQQLFAERLGFADVLLEVEVRQVFGKGRYQGRKDQYVAVAIEEVIMGALPDGVEDEQLLVIKGEDALPGALSDARLLLFVKWAPGEVPSYHHHLMPADEGTLEMIGAMVKHAQEEGFLDANGEVTKGRSRKRRKQKGKTPSDAAPADGDPPA